jgi:hypothetical protein
MTAESRPALNASNPTRIANAKYLKELLSII